MATSSSIPSVLNFRIKQGDTFQRTITFETDDDTPQPIDLSGATVVMRIDQMEDLTEGDGLTVGGDDNNILTISKIITWSGTYRYELEVTFGSGVIKTYYEGRIRSKAQLV